MHTGAVNAELRLGHKGRMQSMTLCNRLDRHLKGHQVIRC